MRALTTVTWLVSAKKKVILKCTCTCIQVITSLVIVSMLISGVSKVGHGRGFALPIANDSVYF